MFISPRWHVCDHDEESHLVGPWCAGTVSARAFPQPLQRAPRAAAVASSHRTVSTSRSFGIATPLGRTSRFSSPY